MEICFEIRENKGLGVSKVAHLFCMVAEHYGARALKTPYISYRGKKKPVECPTIANFLYICRCSSYHMSAVVKTKYILTKRTNEQLVRNAIIILPQF